MSETPPKPRRFRRILGGIGGVLAALVAAAVVGMIVWANAGVMRAEPDPLAAVLERPEVTVEALDGSLILTPRGKAPKAGLVFLAGAKVEPDAYAAKLSSLVVDDDMAVILPQPLLNLAFFDTRPVESFTELVPEVTTWAVGGHSLGGVRACQLAESPEVSGLLLLGSYCADDLADADLDVLSLSGSADGLSTPEKVSAARDLLPADAALVEVEGANHAMFGDYGPQSGDGEATISDAEAATAFDEALHAWAERLASAR